MTVQELIDAIGQHSIVLVSVFAALPLVTFLLGLSRRGQADPGGLKYVYSVIVYAASVPGIFAAVVTAYVLFFTGSNLLQVNALVHLLPIVSMVVTLVLVAKSVELDRIPGFDRLTGLMIMIGISFGIALAIAKTRIWILFGGSIFLLFAIAGFAFVLLKWGTYSLFRRKDEPKQPMPGVPQELRID